MVDAIVVSSPCAVLRDAMVEVVARVTRLPPVPTASPGPVVVVERLARDGLRPAVLLAAQPPQALGPAVRALRERVPTVRIGVHLVDPSPTALVASLATGVDGVLSASEDRARFGHQLAAFVAGRAVNSTEQCREAERLAHANASRDALAEHLRAAVTPTEQRVLQALAKGGATHRIAVELHVTDATVNTYVKRLLAKFAVGNRLELVLAAVRLGLVSLQGVGDRPTAPRDRRGHG